MKIKEKYFSAVKMLLAAVCITVMLCVPAFAMNVKIAFTDPSAKVGEEVTVSMHITSTSGEALGTANIMLEYDASALEFVSGDMAEGGAGSLRISGQLTTDAKEWYYGLHFRPLKTGETDIKVSTAELYDRDGKIAAMDHTGSSHITVAAGENGETEVAASETAAESAGAPAGSLKVQIEGTEYTVTENFDASLLPRNYEAETYSYLGNSVMAGKSGNEHVRLMYLIAEGGTGDLFLYDDEQNVWAPYVEVGMNAKTIVAVPLGSEAAVPDELTESRLNLNGKMVDGWIGRDDQGQNFCVFYGMNAEGSKSFYRFDLAEKTIQRYFNETSVQKETEEPGEVENTELQELQKKYQERGILLIAAAAAAVLALIAAVMMAMKKSGGSRAAGQAESDAYRPAARGETAGRKLPEEDPESGDEEEEDAFAENIDLDEPEEAPAAPVREEIPEEEAGDDAEEAAEAEDDEDGEEDDDFEDIDL